MKFQGEKLISEVEIIAKEKNCSFVQVDTMNLQTLKFYKKLYYKTIDVVKNII